MPGINERSSGPDHGRRLLPTVIDERAQHGHHRPYASIPVSNYLSDGFRDVTYLMFANAINRCALWLKERVGMSNDFEALVYIGPSDLRYQILCMAAVKTGHVMFLVSPRNSMEAYMSLLDEAAATKLIAPSDAPPAVAQILQNRQMQRLVVPELNTLLDQSPVEAMPFEKSFDEYRMEPWILLHTSGSTGIPKVITIRHGYTTTIDAYSRFGSEIKQRSGNLRLFNPFPPFHMSGIMWSLPIVIFIDSTIVLPPSSPLTAELANSVHEKGAIEYSSLPPSVVTELAKSETYLHNLRKLRGLTFAGGPLSKETGDLVSKYTHLNTSYGATEIFAPPLLPRTREQWQCHRFNTEYGGIEFRETDDGLFELVIVRDETIDLMQAVFVTFPDLQEYHTKDLFSKHPKWEGLWVYEGRLDDIIVFSNGEKLNPVSMEGTITACPEVTGSLVVGQGRFQSALIVEAKNPPKSNFDAERLTNLIWPFVQQANRGCVQHGRIAKELIGFTSPEKPFSRAGKGTIQRSRSVAMYKEEIDKLYMTLDTVEESTKTRLDLCSAESAKISLQEYIKRDMGLEAITPEDDFFKTGMDSLQLISLVRAINASLKDRQIDPKQVYDNASIEKLATSLHSDIPPLRYDDDDIDAWIEMQEMFQEVKWNLPRKILPALGRKSIEHNIFSEKISEGNRVSHLSSMSVEKPVDRGVSWTQMQTLFMDFAWDLPQEPYQASVDKEFLMSMVPPDGGRIAWLQVLASFLINVNNWGLINSFGVFQSFYEIELLAHKSPSTIAWIGTVQAALLLIVGVFSGPLFDKGYFRVIIVGAGLVLVFALMMLSLSTEYYQIMLSQGVLLGLCSGLLYIPSVALMPLYFKDRRGLALGLATSGGSVGGVIYPIAFRRLLTEVGFPWATRIIGFIALATLTIAAAIARPLGPTKKPMRELFELSAVKDIPFLAFMLSAFFLFCAFLVPFFLTPTFANYLGASENTAFYLLAVINAAQLFGRVIPAFLSDYFGGEIMQFAAEILTGILGLCWIAVHNVGGFTVFLIFFGFASGMVATLPAVVMPYVCPSLAVMGTRLGMVYAAAGVGALIGAPVATAAASASGKFLGAQLWMGLCSLVAAVFFAVTGVAAFRQRRLIDEPKKFNMPQCVQMRPIELKKFNFPHLIQKRQVDMEKGSEDTRHGQPRPPILPLLNLGSSLSI